MLKARYKEDEIVEAGIDEAGRGCLWGPLVAAAVVLAPEAEWSPEFRTAAPGIKDSKKVTPKRRGVLEALLKEHAAAWGLGIVTPAEIDELGMTAANRLAFTRAVGELSMQPGRLLIDGILAVADTVAAGAEQIVEPKADGTYLAVAAASILAKEGRDRMVAEACAADATLDERYGILGSKGYGTAKHRSGVTTHGMHSLHRRLFLRKLLGHQHLTAAQKAAEGICLLDD